MDTILSPNWKAISTVHIRYQTFVTESEKNINLADTNKKRKPNIINLNTTGKDEVCQIYEEIINTPSNYKPKKKILPVKRKKIPSTSKKMYTKNSLFKASIEDNSELVYEILKDNPMFLNEKDDFGWTSLMMSACEGSVNSFNTLLDFGADINIKDKKNHTAISLAKNKNRNNILAAFSEYNQRKSNDDSDSEIEFTELQKADPFFCTICNHAFKESTREEHNTSTLHQFIIKHHNFPRRFGISETNKGFQLMLKQGWDKNSGLGPQNSGHLFPVKTVLRDFRTGLGVEQNNEPRVTHFKPYDLRAVKRRNSDPKPESKKEFISRIEKDKRKERKIRKELS